MERPGATTFGANALRGIYANLGKCAGASGSRSTGPDHWAFRGAHLGYGDVLGAASRIFGYEVDGLRFGLRTGCRCRPAPMGRCPIYRSLPWASPRPGKRTTAFGARRFTSATWIQNSQHSLCPERPRQTLSESHARGNGVIVSWPRGAGEVFNAATCEWVAGLLRGDAQVAQVTRNVLDRFGSRG